MANEIKITVFDKFGNKIVLTNKKFEGNINSLILKITQDLNKNGVLVINTENDCLVCKSQDICNVLISSIEPNIKNEYTEILSKNMKDKAK